MVTQRDAIYAKHIAGAIDGIERFLGQMTFDEFVGDLKTQLAVARELEIIGEAAKRPSEEYKDARKNIPWKEICGMRDFLIHDYMDVDLKEIWKTAIEDIPALKQSILVS